MAKIERVFKVVSRTRGRNLDGRRHTTALVSVHEKDFTAPLSWFLYRTYDGENRSLIQHFTEEKEAQLCFPNGLLGGTWLMFNDWLSEIVDMSDPLVVGKAFYRKVDESFFAGATKLLEHKPPPAPVPPSNSKSDNMLLQSLGFVVESLCIKLREELEADGYDIVAEPERLIVAEEPLTRIWYFHGVLADCDGKGSEWVKSSETLFLVFFEYRASLKDPKPAKLFYSEGKNFPLSCKKQFVNDMRDWAMSKLQVKAEYRPMSYLQKIAVERR